MGQMMGAKGMGAARMAPHKQGMNKGPATPPAKAPAPVKNPRSVHIREANGGYILSKHGGEPDGDEAGGAGGFPADHVAGDFDAAMEMAREHMGAGTKTAPPSKPKDDQNAKEAAPDNMKVKPRAHSASYADEDTSVE